MLGGGRGERREGGRREKRRREGGREGRERGGVVVIMGAGCVAVFVRLPA